MIQTVEAMIDESGAVRLLHAIRIPAARRALVTILDERPAFNFAESTSGEAWDVPSDDVQLLLRETAAWESASDEDALMVERMLSESR